MFNKSTNDVEKIIDTLTEIIDKLILDSKLNIKNQIQNKVGANN